MTSSDGTALVLGFPSSISEMVATELLESGVVVYLLLPQEFFARAAHLKKRFGKQLQLTVGRGDYLDFGLGGQDYLKIARQTGTVYSLYSADEPRTGLDFQSSHVRELVEFCKVAPGLSRLVLLSDFSFVGEFNGVVAERDWELPETSLRDREREFRAEKVLSRFLSTFPISIVRVGTLVGTVTSLFPAVMLTLGYPELFSRSGVLIYLAEVTWAARRIVEIASKAEPGLTFHLFQKSCEPGALGMELMQYAMAQVPRTYDLRAAARRRLKNAGEARRQLAAAQIEAKVENTWTNNYFRAHNFSALDQSLNWQPLVEADVEKLTGFR